MQPVPAEELEQVTGGFSLLARLYFVRFHRHAPIVRSLTIDNLTINQVNISDGSSNSSQGNTLELF
jgi:hypothetical protein